MNAKLVRTDSSPTQPGSSRLAPRIVAMSSMVLARKYRPGAFDSMVGQSHVVKALANALSQGRLHHAYLFTGTRGVGKTTVSRILAKSLNCVGADGHGGITAQPCGVCQPCLDIDRGRFVDYVEMDAASNRGVDEISQLLEQAVYKPALGRFKVYMIDEVHMLTTTAFNAMLKTLEEPPEHLKFVLATTDPQKVPVTVLSRCLQFNLRPISAATIAAHLGEVLDGEHIGHDGGSLRLLARAARGSMRDALSLTDQAIAYSGGQLQEGAVRQMLGSVDRGHIRELIEAIAAGDGRGVVAIADRLREQGWPASSALEELATALQRMAVLQAVPQLAEHAQDDDERLWAQLAPVLRPDETQLFYSLALQGRQELAWAVDEYSGLTMVLLRLLAFKPGSSLALQAGGGGPQPNAVPRPERQRTPEPAPEPEPEPEPANSPGAASDRETSPPPKSEGSAVPAAAEPQASAVTDIPPWVDQPLDEQAALPAGLQPDIPQAHEWAPAAAAAPDEEAWTRAQRREGGISPRVEPQVPAQAAADLALPNGGPHADQWTQMVEALVHAGAIQALTRELAMQAQCLAHEQGPAGVKWVLRVERASLCTPAHQQRLQQALSEAHGQAVELEISTGVTHDTPARRQHAHRVARQAQARAIITGDALVQGLLREHPGARLIEESIQIVE